MLCWHWVVAIAECHVARGGFAGRWPALQRPARIGSPLPAWPACNVVSLQSAGARRCLAAGCRCCSLWLLACVCVCVCLWQCIALEPHLQHCSVGYVPLRARMNCSQPDLARLHWNQVAAQPHFNSGVAFHLGHWQHINGMALYGACVVLFFSTRVCEAVLPGSAALGVQLRLSYVVVHVWPAVCFPGRTSACQWHARRGPC